MQIIRNMGKLSRFFGVMVKRTVPALLLMLLCTSRILAQKKNVSLKDSIDGKFDMSDYIIEANGFVPIPYIITEPAFGGFGGALIPVFIKKRPPYVDTIKGKVVRTPVAPDITGGIGVYTVNNTWVVGAFRSGTFIKQRIKYIIGGGYANVNMSFYRTLGQLGEKELEFNFKGVPAMLQVTKRLGRSHWYAGLKYLYLKTDVKYVGDTLFNRVGDLLESDKTVSQLGVVVELDNRDNVFTPDRGIKFHIDGINSADWLGSDFEYWMLNYYLYAYKPISRKLIAGVRIDGQQSFNDPPFYLLPFVSMRGIPNARYQGNATLLTELEARWDVQRRWSLVFFGGAGKAFDEWSDYGDADVLWTYGTGFRYLLARKFKLRVGIDVARGPSTWAYYVVFGSNWLK
jgi:hypothetical protein